MGTKQLPLVVSLKEPCPMRWEDMLEADAGRRFCRVCEKHVYDLSERSPEQIRQLLQQRVCVNFEYRRDASIVTGERKGGGAARVVMAAALATLTGCSGHHNEDADYPRLGGAIMPTEEETKQYERDVAEAAAGAAGSDSAGSESGSASAAKASCDH